MKCEKCDFESEQNKKLPGTDIILCSICSHFCPSPDSEKFPEYISEKTDWKSLESFRKFQEQDKNLSGMKKKASQGKIMSRAAFGYKIENKELLPNDEKRLIVQEIFHTFLNTDISLNQLAKKHGFSVNGLKKILKNFTYIGKVKFSGQIMQGKHEPIISPELFNKVQNKLESLGIN
jgi:hypothetical protein